MTLATCGPKSEPSFYPIHEAVRLVHLDAGDPTTQTSLSDFVSRTKALHAMLASESFDVALGFMYSIYIPLGYAAIGTGVPVVASDHLSPKHYAKRPLNALLFRLAPLTVRRITVVSDQVRLGYPRWLRGRMTVVENPVDHDAGPPADVVGERKRPKILLCVGRFEPQKDHVTLVRAFARVAGELPDWNLRIVGEGRLRGELEALVRELGLEGRVELPGFTDEVHEQYRAAQLFVIPSKYESFGLVTAEALLHGLPVVGFAECPGVNRMVRHGENGLLVEGPDRVASLAGGLRQLMSAPSERVRLAAGDNAWITGKHTLPAILDKWEALLADVVAGR